MSGFMQTTTGLMNASIGAQAAQDASGIQSQYGERAIQEANGIYVDHERKFDPYIDSGNKANQMLSDGMGQGGSLGRAFTMADFYADPAYKFDVQQGLEAIGNSNSVRGGALSGGTLKALSNYGMQQASNEYGQAATRFRDNQNQNFSQLSHLAGTGLNAVQGQATLGQNYSRANTEELNNIGTAKAAGILGKAQAWQKGISEMGQGISSMYGGNSNMSSLGSMFGS